MNNLEWAKAHFSAYSRIYDLYHNYYYGEHECFFGKIIKYPKLDELIHGTRANVCKTIVDIFCSRLELSGLTTANDKAQEWIDEYFKAERITSLANAVHRDTSIYGDAYVSVWIDEKGLKLFNEMPNNTAVHYNEYNEIDMAIKYAFYTTLNNKDKTKVWIYTPETIAQGEQDGQSLNFDGIKIIDEKENPLKIVPFFHFYNGIRPTDFTRSDLHEVIPLQRNLNKTLQDRALASEMGAYKQKWVTGINYQRDENGKQINPFPADVSKMWAVSGENIKFGEFSETNLANYTAMIDSIHNEIACVSRIPMHLFNLSNGNFPSGEALKTAEAPLLAKINDKQIILGDVWEDIFKLLLKLNNMDAEDLEAVWADTQPHNELEQWQIAATKNALGVSGDRILLEQGYSQQEIEEFKADRQPDYYG